MPIGYGGFSHLILCTMERIDTATWAPYIVTSTQGRVYLSHRLALFVDGAVLSEIKEEALTASRLAQFLAGLECLLARMDAVVGRAPPVTHSFQGRQVVEVAHLPGAAGLAHHGRAGFACGPAFLRESLLSFDCPGTQPFIHHVFGYEAFRNYIFPEEFTPCFKYSCLEGPECYGWFNQGFVNIVGCLLLADEPLGIKFNYFGHSEAAFRAGMESHLLVYIARRHGVQCGGSSGAGGGGGGGGGGGATCLSFADVFLHERLPWAPHQSLDNLFSGILSVLFRAHGGAGFLRGLFRTLPLLRERCPRGVFDFGRASENMYLACCGGARADLAPFFEGLGFPLGQDAKDLVGVVLALA